MQKYGRRKISDTISALHRELADFSQFKKRKFSDICNAFKDITGFSKPMIESPNCSTKSKHVIVSN